MPHAPNGHENAVALQGLPKSVRVGLGRDLTVLALRFFLASWPGSFLVSPCYAMAFCGNERKTICEKSPTIQTVGFLLACVYTT